VRRFDGNSLRGNGARTAMREVRIFRTRADIGRRNSASIWIATEVAPAEAPALADERGKVRDDYGFGGLRRAADVARKIRRAPPARSAQKSGAHYPTVDEAHLFGANNILSEEGA